MVKNTEVAEISKAAATAERERISAILNHAEAKQRPQAAQRLALTEGLDVDAAVAILAAMPRESTGNEAFDRAMALSNPELGAAGGGNFTDDADSKAKVDGVLRAAGYDGR